MQSLPAIGIDGREASVRSVLALFGPRSGLPVTLTLLSGILAAIRSLRILPDVILFARLNRKISPPGKPPVRRKNRDVEAAESRERYREHEESDD